MSDLPKWAQGDGEGTSGGSTGGGGLEDKLVDEEAGAPAAAPAAAPPASDPANETVEDSGLASRALCFFKFLAILTVLLALVVIGTNCYIIYKQADKIKGESRTLVLLR